MPVITYREATSNAIREEMLRDPRVIFMGQDVELQFDENSTKRIGVGRIRNTPISEAGFIGAGTGAALTGMRAIVELGCCTFLYSAMDQIVNQAAKSRYMFGGQASVPLVIRMPVFYGIAVAAHHSDRPWGLFSQAPGLKIIVPTTPHDVKGLLKSAIRDGNPVLCFEEFSFREQLGEVPDEDYTVPIGVADVKRPGTDLTIVAVGGSVQQSLIAAHELESGGISAEVIDVRTVAPLDRATILESVAKTGRLIAVDPAPGNCSLASEVAATVAEELFDCLRGPPVRLTAPNVPVPFSPELERLIYPTANAILAAARRQFTTQKTFKVRGA